MTDQSAVAPTRSEIVESAIEGLRSDLQQIKERTKPTDQSAVAREIAETWDFDYPYKSDRLAQQIEAALARAHQAGRHEGEVGRPMADMPAEYRDGRRVWLYYPSWKAWTSTQVSQPAGWVIDRWVKWDRGGSAGEDWSERASRAGDKPLFWAPFIVPALPVSAPGEAQREG